MDPLSRTRRLPSAAGLVLVIVVAGCTSTTATPSPTVVAPSAAAVASVEPSASATASPSATPMPAPSATPAVSPLAADFTSPPIGSAQAPWTGIAWTPIAADDPLGTVTGMVAAPGSGYAAWAAPVAVSGTTSASPLWASADGAAWHALPADTLGPAGVVIAMGPADGTLVALTLQGGKYTCSDGTAPDCWTLASPLQAWTSIDGTTWTPSTAPDIALPSDCSDCGVDVPTVAFGGPGVLVMEAGGDSRQLALSADGASWTDLPATTLPATFQIGGIAGTGTELVAAGDNGKDPARAEVATTTDGITWTTELLTGQGHPAEGSSGGRLFVAADGILLDGATQDVPGGDLWWSKPDGANTWQFQDGYPPLGVWTGEGEGSGLLPDGTVAADGTHLLALRTDGGVKSWVSNDGAAWTSIPSTGLKATPKGSWPTRDIRMLPAGIIATEDSGASWFGAPAHGS